MANAAVLVRYGDTTVLVCATASDKPKEGIDYFPLTVDFEEKLYSVGRIPGAFLRREGRPSERGILASRLIDRPMRPLFPSDLRNDVVITCNIMSVDHDCSPEIAAMLGASAAVAISDIPWAGPIGGVVVGYDGENYLFNPTSKERDTSQMAVTVAATMQKIVMIEAAAKEVPEQVMFDGIMKAHEIIKPVIELINKMVADIGKPKFTYEQVCLDADMFEDIQSYCLEKVEYCMDTDDKNIREERLSSLRDDLAEHFSEKYPDIENYMEEILYRLQKKVVKAWLLDGKRVDGRKMDEIRPLAAEVGLIPRVHGSGLFTRGQTQVLSIVTLDTLSAAQKLDTIYEDESALYAPL